MRKEAYFAALRCLCDKDILVYRSHLGQAYRREKNVEGMGNSRMKRSLAAVLAADVAGYSKLLGQDTEKTLTSLRRLRTEVFGPTVASRRGMCGGNFKCIGGDCLGTVPANALKIQALKLQICNSD